MNKQAFFDELLKLGFVSDDEAKGSLGRLEKLEGNKLTPGQVGRYAAIGSVVAPSVNILKNAIKGGTKGLIEGSGVRGKLRHIAADAVGGAVLTGTVPIIRARADQHSEVKKLRTYLSERGEQV